MIELYELTIKDTFEFINYDEIDVIVDLLDKCSMVDIYTHSHNLNAAENFEDKMLTIGKMFLKQSINKDYQYWHLIQLI